MREQEQMNKRDQAIMRIFRYISTKPVQMGINKPFIVAGPSKGSPPLIHGDKLVWVFSLCSALQ